MKTVKLPLVLCFAVFLAGCSSAVLVSNRSGEGDRKHSEGQMYYLPKAMLRFAYLPGEQNSALAKLTISTVLVKDEKQAYRLSYVPQAHADDVISWKIGEDGVLKNIEVKTTDKTAEIASKVVDLITEVAKATVAPPGATATRAVSRPANKYFDIMIDPETIVGKKISGGDLEVLGIGSVVTCLEVQAPARFDTYDEYVQGGCEGVYYREALPWNLRVTYTLPGNEVGSVAEYVKDVPFDIPNGNSVKFFGIKRRALVESGSTIQFINGVPREVSITKPSEFLAGMDIPVKLVRGIVSIPTEVLQLKFNYSSKNEALYTQLLKELTAKDAYIEALKKKIESSPGQRAAPE